MLDLQMPSRNLVFRLPRLPFARLALFVATSIACASLAFGAPLKFELPAQPMPAALTAVAKQADVQLLFSHSDLKELNAPALVGSFEVVAALNKLLEGTGYVAVPQGARQFLVRKVNSGSVQGLLLLPEGTPAAEVNVMIRGLARSAATNQNGVYIFPEVPVGTYLLIARAEGFQPLHLTDVEVRAGRETILKQETMRCSSDLTKLSPFVVSAEAVTSLGQFDVYGQRARPFADGNTDIPRTMNDVQPYYIFDSKALETSGAVNVEDFLKQRLSMNTTAQTFRQEIGVATNLPYGGGSQINLRGVGTDKTLILVDGRRIAGIAVSGVDAAQADLNGIPISAIDRIEVLPSSASGIYGGNAIGGVVNVILKKNYQGGEIRAVYDNAWDNDAPTRTVSASYGFSLEGGRTKVMLRASWNDVNPMVQGDRRSVYNANINRYFSNVYAAGWNANDTLFSIWPGPYTNVVMSSGASLVLKGGTSLGSSTTFVPAGTSPGTPSATLAAGLLANAKKWSYGLVDGAAQGYVGSDTLYGIFNTSRSYAVNVRRDMSSWLEAFVDFSYEGRSSYRYNGPGSVYTLSAASPVNPFTTAVGVRLHSKARQPSSVDKISRNVTAGLLAKLPGGWLANFDYSYSASAYDNRTETIDTSAILAGMNSGLYNPFVDLNLYPLPFDAQPRTLGYTEQLTTQDEFSLRAAGTLPSLPWGEPRMVAGLQHRTVALQSNRTESITPNPVNVIRQFWFPRDSVAKSAYTEISVPLLREGRIPLVHSLEAQVAGRTERYSAETGTQSIFSRPNATPPFVNVIGPRRNGEPFVDEVKFGSTDYTVGIKYQPTRDITFRASHATAFLPPTPAQLAPGILGTFATTVVDRRTNTPASVFTITGGNPDVIPQNSESTSAGLIWLPRQSALKGLRVNLEYNRIEQFDFISTLSAQTIVDLESDYPTRVTRNTNGVITTVDTSAMNLFLRDSDSLDLNVDYQRKTAWGTWNFNLNATRLLSLTSQLLLTRPMVDAAGHSPGDGGAPEYKGALSIGWEQGPWNAVWTTSYTGSYLQYGVAGGPTSVRSFNGGVSDDYIVPHGGTSISSQTYHDASLSYAFGAGADRAKTANWRERVAQGLTLQLGVRNVFNTVPPFDAYYMLTHAGTSPFADLRLRSYWVSVKKTF